MKQRFRKSAGNIIIETSNTDVNCECTEMLCDTLVYAIGNNSENILYEKLKDKIPNIHVISDAKTVGKILDAVKTAHELAMII